ncbi:MAG: hypothetical protein V3S43_06355 [Acidimicrobiia bacterium]
MARITLQPSDENATISRTQASGVGVSTNEALGGFDALAAVAARIRIVDGQSSASANTNSPGDVADNESRIEYSIDGGGSWVIIAGYTSALAGVGPGHPESESTSVGATDITTNVGNLTDLSLVRLRVVAEIVTQTNSPTQTCSASFTNWEVSYQAILSILDG